MKKFLLIVLALAVCVTTVEAQSSKEAIKDQRAVLRQTTKDLEKKVSKTVRKEAKKLQKQGWTVAPGYLPMEKQLERVYSMQYVLNEDGSSKYIVGTGESIGENYDAAHMQAVELAKMDLAGKVSSNVSALIDQKIANTQSGVNGAASIVETVAASKNVISQRIGRVVVGLECYREVAKTHNKEVRVMVLYDTQVALESAKQVIREELADKGEELQKELDALLGF